DRVGGTLLGGHLAALIPLRHASRPVRLPGRSVMGPRSVPAGCSGTCRWEDDRVIVRSRLRLLISLCCLIPTLSGCSDRFLAGPMQYVENDALTKEVKGKNSLAGKPKLRTRCVRRLRSSTVRIPRRSLFP